MKEIDLPRLDDANLSDKERDGLISRLHKRAMQYAHILESELLALDAISGGDDVRALRKEQVSKVQTAIDAVDKLQKRLKELHVEHRDLMDKKEVEQQSEKPQTPPPAPGASSAGAPAPEKSQSPAPEQPESAHDQPKTAPPVGAGEKRTASPPAAAAPSAQLAHPPSFAERLANQKLEIQFQVKDRPSSFLISAYVPGVDEESLTIGLNEEGDTLTCSGVRLPSPQEMQVLRSHPSVMRYPVHLREEAMLRLAAGRFGRFEEKWRVDNRTVDAEKITAGYNSGVIEIQVPKKQQPRQMPVHRRPQQHPYMQRSPYGGYPYGGYW